jgi:hypothetical protein
MSGFYISRFDILIGALRPGGFNIGLQKLVEAATITTRKLFEEIFCNRLAISIVLVARRARSRTCFHWRGREHALPAS